MTAQYFVGIFGSSVGYTMRQLVDIGISLSTLLAILVLAGVVVANMIDKD